MRTLAFYKEKLAGLLHRREEISQAIEEAQYVVVDTELTGLELKKDSIISIGAVKMAGNRIELGNTFYQLISHPGEMPHESVAIHGITPSDLTEQPVMEKVLAEFLDFCGRRIIVGHFLSLDLAFLNNVMKQLYGAALPNPGIDTAKIYRWMKANNENFSRHYSDKPENMDLFTLARELGIALSNGHNALGDAFITAQLFQRFLASLPGLGVRTVKELLIIGRG
ncbi:MAG: 3'-5' exonuclease [Smithellaceae bacterium]|nr:3'-5' exonuclease [Smithellaceae bacterium]